MRMLIGLVAGALCLNAYAEHDAITSYNQLGQALKKGCNIKVLVNYDNCTLKTNNSNESNPAQGASTRFSFNTYSSYKLSENNKAKSVFSFPFNVYTEHPKQGFVLAYGRLRVYEDNAVEVHTSMYDPGNYKVKAGYDYQCHLGNDKNSIAIYAD